MLVLLVKTKMTQTHTIRSGLLTESMCFYYLPSPSHFLFRWKVGVFAGKQLRKGEELFINRHVLYLFNYDSAHPLSAIKDEFL